MSRTASDVSAQFPLELRVAAGNAHEFDLWHWGVSPMFAMDARDRAARSSFGLDAVSYQFADVAVSSATSSATSFERTRPVIARSGLDSVLVLTYLAGGYALNAGGREIEVNAGDICILDMTQRCALHTSAYKHLGVMLPRQLLERLVAGLEDLHGLVLPRGTPLNGLLMAHLRTLYSEAPSLGLLEGRAAARGTAALVAACVGPSLGPSLGLSADARGAAGEAVAAASMQAVRRAIEASLGDPALGPELLAQRFGMSRATLYRLFEPLGGVRSYIQQRRLTRAYQAISDPASHGERIGAIARRHGFGNDTVFSRAFRRAYGLSPSDMRAMARAGSLDVVSPRRADDDSFWAMNRWLLGLDAYGR